MINRDPKTASGKAALDEFLRQDDQQHRIVLDWDDIGGEAVKASDAARQENGYSLLTEESTAERTRLEGIEQLARQYCEAEARQSMEADSAFRELAEMLGVEVARGDCGRCGGYGELDSIDDSLCPDCGGTGSLPTPQV